MLTSESIFLSLLVMSRVTFLSPAVMSPPLLSSANMFPPAGLEGAAAAGFGASTGAAAGAAAGLGAAALLLLNSVALPPCRTQRRPTHWAEPSDMRCRSAFAFHDRPVVWKSLTYALRSLINSLKVFTKFTMLSSLHERGKSSAARAQRSGSSRSPPGRTCP